MKMDHDARSAPGDDAREPTSGGDEAATPEGEAPTAQAPGPEATAAGEDAGVLRDRWLRAEAELQNVRRRSARELDDARRTARERVLLDALEILDDLERALQAIGERAADDALATGVALTAQRVRDMLARHGVQPIESVGQPFDPNVHEALLEVPAPEGVPPGHVVQEVLRGWRSGDRPLRAARVVVARAGD